MAFQPAMTVVPTFFALSSNIWDQLSDVAGLVIALLFILAGALIGFVLRWLIGRWQADSAEKSALMKAEAIKAEIESLRKEAEVAAKAEVVRAREEFESSIASRRADQEQAEARLSAREESLDRKSTLLDAREAVLKSKAEEAAKAADEAQRRMAEADSKLQSLAKMTHIDARREVLRRANAALREDAESMSRRIQEAAREQGEDIARNIIADAIGRCAVSHLNETTVSAVSVPNAEMKGRIVGRDGRNVRAFESVTGVNLLLDDAPDSVVVSAFDPVRREVARRALEALVADGRIHPSSIEEAVKAAQREVASSNAKAAEAAVVEAGVAGLSGDILSLMGALKYRTSFSQNVLRHSVEVALLSGAMASELGLDAAKGRRIGFLHDIGKAITGEKKGAHALLGAEFLKANGEDQSVCDAVAAHHGETDSNGGVYGVLCAAADAISSARPGARQETLGDYVQRLEDFERIARKYDGVMNVMAVQAGRDLRVVVDPDKVPDTKASELAREICREISATRKFPGQIRVTVIRETRCVEYAR
jgi:ribonuclease Y